MSHPFRGPPQSRQRRSSRITEIFSDLAHLSDTGRTHRRLHWEPSLYWRASRRERRGEIRPGPGQGTRKRPARNLVARGRITRLSSHRGIAIREPHSVLSDRSAVQVGKEAFIVDRPWFDQETDVLLIDEYIVELDSYKRIVQDGKITDTELLEQTLRVTTLLRQLEETLSPEAKALATEALGEMAVLNALQALRLQASSALP